jgi:hypothetical protein
VNGVTTAYAYDATSANRLLMSTDASGTTYYMYGAVDNETRAIVQVSNNLNPLEWIPDSGIVDPYRP